MRRGLQMLAMLLVPAALASAQAPPDWLLGQTGRGTARWSRQAGGLTYHGGAAFGWAVRPDTSVRDGVVEVRLKPVEGREDRAGGVVWRWRDADNYYVARANALENNMVAYRMVRSRRTALTPVGTPSGTYGVNVPVAAGAWHTLRVEFHEAESTVVHDGRALFTVRDDTFAAAGAVGIWAKADSVTEFDHFHYEEKP